MNLYHAIECHPFSHTHRENDLPANHRNGRCNAARLCQRWVWYHLKLLIYRSYDRIKARRSADRPSDHYHQPEYGERTPSARADEVIQ